MKIVLPFLMYDDNNLDSPNVYGGIERFSQLIYQYSGHEVIPFYYNVEDTKKRTVTKNLSAFIKHHNPDLVIVNRESNTLTNAIMKSCNIPVLLISHTAAGGISKIGHLDIFKEFIENGGTLAMVSQWQYKGMNKLCQRIHKHELELNGGFINSAFCSGDEEVSDDIVYDCITVGRVDATKDPFALHKVTNSLDLKSIVLTSNSNLNKSQL